MSLVDAVRTVLSKYANFSGRARRSEYWFWGLALLLAYFTAAVVGAVVNSLGTLLTAVVFLGSFVPSLAVGTRRLHDTNRSGALLLLSLIPFIGSIILLVFTCSDSTPGENQYGPYPKTRPVGYISKWSPAGQQQATLRTPNGQHERQREARLDHLQANPTRATLPSVAGADQATHVGRPPPDSPGQVAEPIDAAGQFVCVGRECVRAGTATSRPFCGGCGGRNQVPPADEPTSDGALGHSFCGSCGQRTRPI